MTETIHDVIVVGAGPVGLTTARLLGLAGHDVLVVERWPEAYPLPRAVHFDHEIGRILQSAELTEQVKGVSERVPDFYEWRAVDGQPLLKIDWSGGGPCGWPVANFFSQPDLERVLGEAVEAMPNVRLVRGSEVVQIREDDDRVDVTVTSRTRKHLVHAARFVIGCDGANSYVRQHMSTSLTDLGFYFDWLIVDTIPLDDREWSPMNWQLCDPARPTTIVSGGPGRRRWEFMRLPEEDRDELNTIERAWELLATQGRTPENTEIERHAVYTFQARWADVWNQGRLLLAGDAAHLMPPFAGQGMCSGIRDAANLAWKLDLVLTGKAGPGLLDTYTSERSEHLQHAISMSVALGQTICVLDPDEARERDERMIAAGADPRTALPPMPPERLGEGAWDAVSTPGAVQGTLAPQFTVTRDGSTGLYDDVIGRGFSLIGYGVDPCDGLDERQRAVLDDVGVQCVVITDGDDEPLAAGCTAVASDESARAYFEDPGVSTIVVRPDFYLYGAASDPAAVGELVDALHRDLRLTAASMRDLDGATT